MKDERQRRSKPEKEKNPEKEKKKQSFKERKLERKKNPPLKFTSQTFELVTFSEVGALVREVFGPLAFAVTPIHGSLNIRCIQLKVKHLLLLNSMDTWKALLYDNSEKLPLLQNTKNFLRATLEHFIDDFDCFLFVQKSQINTIVERIVSLFEPGYIRKSYDELLDFGTPSEDIQLEVIKAQNNFLFRYLIGWMGLFFHFSTEAAELRYYDSNSMKVHNPLKEKEETANYLSNLVYNPTFEEIKRYESFELLKMIHRGNTKRIAKSCVGSKVFKKLDDETKLKLLKYFENFSAVAKRKITNELPQHSRQFPGLTKFFSSIVIEGIRNDLFPKENILSCSKKIQDCLQYLYLYKPKKDTHIFETLNPCYDPVPVPFIEHLKKKGFSLDFQRAVFYNSMYFFKIFSLQVIGVYRNFVIEEERCTTHNEYKHKLAAKNIEFINDNVTTFESTDDEEGSIVKNTTFQTPRKNHPNLISEREEPIVRKSNLMSMKSEIC